MKKFFVVLLAIAAVVFVSCNKDSKDEPSHSSEVDPSAEPEYDIQWTEKYVNAKRDKITLVGQWYVLTVTTFSSGEPQTSIFEALAAFQASLDVHADGTLDVLLGGVNFGAGTWTVDGDQLSITADIMLAGHQEVTATLINQSDGNILVHYLNSIEAPVDYSEVTLVPYTDGMPIPEASLNKVTVEGEPTIKRSWHLDRAHRFGNESKDVSVDYTKWLIGNEYLLRGPSKKSGEDTDMFAFELNGQLLTVGTGEATEKYTIVMLDESNMIMRKLNTASITDFDYDEYYFSLSKLVEPAL